MEELKNAEVTQTPALQPAGTQTTTPPSAVLPQSEYEQIAKQQQAAALARKQEEDRINQQAQYLSYLNSVNLEAIANNTKREIVKEVMGSSTMSQEEKHNRVRILVTADAIETTLSKVEALPFDKKQNINMYNLDVLKQLRDSGDKLSDGDIARAQDNIAAINKSLESIAKTLAAEGLPDEKAYKEMDVLEKYAYVANQEEANIVAARMGKLNATKERLGV